VTRPDHPVWTTPFRIDAQPEAFATPAHYRQRDPGLPATLPVHRVFAERQAEPGLVATGVRFCDSPDAEAVAGGIHSKTADHVAIGRHGSFVLFGFQGDPSRLTPVGRRLLLNVLAWARAQDGQPLLAQRKAVPREFAKSKVGADELGYVRAIALTGPFVDEECRKLGVANDAPGFLDALAGRLQRDPADDLARRLLARYAPAAPAADLGAWLAANRARLYFTEWGGYLWQLAPAANEPLAVKGLDGDEVVAIEARADDRMLRIEVKVQPGYHLYPPGSQEGVPIAVELDPRSAFAAAGPLVAPRRPHLEGTVRLELPLQRKGPGDALVARFTWQACDEQMCFPPATVTIER
jgi:hypothetical protein